MKLNLEAKTKKEQKIKDFLEENVSETLALKINNGVEIVKNGQTLLNKKDLLGFIKYACEEAKKTAEQGAISAFVEDEEVYAWAIHYFEEDSIEGKILNLDGTEYIPPRPKPKETPKPAPIEPKKPENKQTSLFDLFDNETKIEQKIEENDTKIEKNDEKIEKNEEKEQKVEKITNPAGTKEYTVDQDGVVLEERDILTSIDKKTMYILHSILDGKLEIQ